MSVEKKSVHVRLDADQHKQLSVMAEMSEKDMAEFASNLLEKAIAGEWHTVNRGLDRLRSLGILREGKGS